MERFEPSTLAGLVFETSAYTVPPHRLDHFAYVDRMIAHQARKVKRLERRNLGHLRLRRPGFPDRSELLIAPLEQLFQGNLLDGGQFTQ